jgi:hypothetical protein
MSLNSSYCDVSGNPFPAVGSSVRFGKDGGLFLKMRKGDWLRKKPSGV